MKIKNISTPPREPFINKFIQPQAQRTQKEINIHIWNRQKTGRHGHDFYEFAVCTKGKLINHLNSEPKQFVNPKQAFFITPDDYHSVVSAPDTPSEHINVSFTPSMFNHICDFLRIPPNKNNFAKNLTLSDEEYAHITALVNNYLIRYDKKKPDETEGLAKFIIANFIVVFSNRTSYSNDIPQWLTDFTNQLHMEKNISLPISELYPLSGYSQTSLSKAFRKYYGTTLVDFFNRIKIQYAYNLLKNTNLKIISIASMIGFDSLSHFNHLFKRITNLTPSEVRSNTPPPE